MGKESLSQNKKTLEFIWSWYEDQREALFDYKSKIIALIINNDTNLIENKFSNFSLGEINQYFDESEKELEHLVCFDIVSATEAHLRVDFDTKVSKRDKSELSRTFRNIVKRNGEKISLEKDIIDQWKIFVPTQKKYFSDFIGLLNYRNWLAHGRYWVPSLGQAYNPYSTYKIAERIFNLLDS